MSGKVRFDPKGSKKKRPEAVFVLALSGAFQFFFTTTTAMKAIFSSSANISHDLRVFFFKVDRTPARVAGSSATFLTMSGTCVLKFPKSSPGSSTLFSPSQHVLIPNLF